MGRRKKVLDPERIRDGQRAVRIQTREAAADLGQPSEETGAETFQDINFVQDGVEEREGEEDKENEVARPRRMIDAHPSSKKISWDDENEEDDDFAQPKLPPQSRRTRQIRDEGEAGPVNAPRTNLQASRKVSVPW